MEREKRKRDKIKEQRRVTRGVQRRVAGRRKELGRRGGEEEVEGREREKKRENVASIEESRWW